MSKVSTAYQRVLLKLSGEVLMGNSQFGIESQTLTHIVNELSEIRQLGVQLAIVIGGGNIFRGANLATNGIGKVSADYMGMLATVMNGLAIQDALQKEDIDVRVMSAIHIKTICEHYNQQSAINHLEKGRVVIFVAGTGNPFFTTDSAASLRAIEIGADIMIKATKVDGVYSADPVTNPEAIRFSKLTYDTVIQQNLGVMDTTAVILCRDNQMPLRVLNIRKAGAVIRAVNGFDEGTLIINEKEESQ